MTISILPALARVALACLVATTACTHVEQAVNPTPQPPPGGPAVQLITDGGGKAALPLAALGISHRTAFTLRDSGFAFGRLVLVTDSSLAYQATNRTNWQLDSGIVTACQGGACGSRRVVVRNSAYIPMAAACTNLGTVRTVAVAGLGSITMANLPGLAEVGARIDTVWGALHQATLPLDSLRIQYGAAGGAAAGYYLGWDDVYYRVRRPSNLGCFTGHVKVVIPDTTSLPQATADRIAAAALPLTILHSDLLANDLSQAGLAATTPVLRLSWQDTGRARVGTRYGTVADTIIAGQPVLLYRRYVASGRADTLTYYLQDGADDRITRTQVYLTLP